jgi:hypothetical protein
LSARTVSAGEDHLKIFKNDWNFMRDLAKETATKFDQQEVMIEQDIIRGAEFVKPYTALPTDLPSSSRGLEKVI